MKERQRVGAIIFFENKIASMYREQEDRTFYTFPGGGMEEDETEEECVVREVFEEFGINVRPIKKLYVYENEGNVEHFYLCEWIDGKFGSGTGEEFQPDRNNGVYRPTLIEIFDIPNLPLMPPKIAKIFFEDYLENGRQLCNTVKIVQKIE